MAGGDIPNGRNTFEMDAEAENGGWKGDIGANNNFGSYEGRQLLE